MTKIVKGFYSDNKLLFYISVLCIILYLVIFQSAQVTKVIAAIAASLIVIIDESTNLFKDVVTRQTIKEAIVNCIIGVVTIGVVGSWQNKNKRGKEKTTKKDTQNDS